MAGGRWMGWWGHLGGPTQRGIVSYTLSPYEQKAFAGAFKKGFFNVVRRVSAQVPYIAPAIAFGYTVYTMGNARHAFYQSKAGAAHAEAH